MIPQPIQSTARRASALRSVGVLLVLLAGCGGNSGNVPTVTLTAPAAFATDLLGALAIAATATDDVRVARVEFQVDGVSVGTLTTPTSAPSGYSVSVDSALYPSGQHVVRVRAADNDNNVSPWASVFVQFGGSRGAPSGITRDETFVTGLAAATAFARAPDGRLFVAQQGGTLRVLGATGASLGTFATFTVDSVGERGLLGVAFDPGFATNRFVYVYYTASAPTTHNRISRLTASVADPNVAEPGSEVAVANLPDLSGATNHNGGAIHFGTDGKLYVGVGENANAANSQNLSTPLGKLLRFNGDGSIPTDNPFCTTPGNLACAVWAYGLRNPFTFAVNPDTGTIHINDVGEVTWEEIDVGAAGANYGWPNSEGPDNVSAGITGPLFTYKHSAAAPPGTGPGGFFVGNVIAGGTFYPRAATMLPASYRGNYFFADDGARFIGRLDHANGNAAYSFGSVSDNPVDMLVANDGALLVLTRGGVTRFRSP